MEGATAAKAATRMFYLQSQGGRQVFLDPSTVLAMDSGPYSDVYSG